MGFAAGLIAAVTVAAVPVGAAAGDGTLKAGDVDLAVVAKPHSSTVIAIDTVTDACAPGDDTERDARVVSFAENTEKPTSGAQLNQVVYDFGSASEAKAFFADLRVNEQQRVQCGTTDKASNFKLTKGPGGVGSARFTVASNEKVGGVSRKVVAVSILTGAAVTELIFLDWDAGLPATTAVAKKAVSRLG